MKRIRISNITKKLCLSVTLIGLVVIIVASSIVLPIIFNVFKENSEQNLISLNEQSINYIDNIINQYELYCRFINNDEYLAQLVNNYAESRDIVDQEKINTRLSDYISFFNGITGITFIFEDNVKFSSFGSLVEISTIQNSEWFTSFKSNGYSRHFSNLVDNSGKPLEDTDKEPYLFIAYPYQNKSIKADLFFQLPFSVFEESINTYIDKELDIVLLGRNNMPIYTYTSGDTSNIDIAAVKNKIFDSNIKSQETNKNNDSLDLISYSKRGGLKLVVNISDKYIFDNFSEAFYLIYYLQLVVFVLFILILWMLISKHLKPLHVITKQINKVSENNINISIDVRSGDELEELAISINKMVLRIQKYLAEIIEHNNRENQMEYALFVAQVNPHFIYKTLSVITYLAEKNQNKDLIDVNNSLIIILKDRLRISKADVFDFIEKEIEVIEAYLVIQRARYGDYIVLEKEIENNLLKEKIPMNIMQPLIENAVFHGLLLNIDESTNIVGGVINLKINTQGEMIKIEVTDNGYGMTQETLEKFFIEDFNSETKKGEHIGVKNLRKRLSYIYGDDYSINVISSLGIGTKVTICIPKQKM